MNGQPWKPDSRSRRAGQNEIRAIESPTHRFYVATLLSAAAYVQAKYPHPLVLAFVQAAADWGRKKWTTVCWNSGLFVSYRSSNLDTMELYAYLQCTVAYTELSNPIHHSCHLN